MCEMRELENLEQEMASMLVQDEAYWRQNDAKFRAVAQNVTYEQFEEIGMAPYEKLAYG
jgi:coiled-coil domain-containing protein 103